MHADVRKQILSYLIAHPNARDSFEGILAWWIPRQSAATVEDVMKAVEDLRRRGWILACGPQNALVYGLVAEAMGKVQEFMRSESERA